MAEPEPLVLLAAGGTGGHLFPAEALAEALSTHGVNSALVTDHRVAGLLERFPGDVHILTSGTVTGGGLFGKMIGAVKLVIGTRQALKLIDRVKPAAVVGFGGYPTVPPIYAATMRRLPTIIHDANAVMGRANRFLAPRVTTIATGFPLSGSPHEGKMVVTGNPVRPAVLMAATIPYAPPTATGPLRLAIFGGSQGAKVMSDVVPSALSALPEPLRARLRVVQQARAEDAVRVRDYYQHHAIEAEVGSFFPDLPGRLAEAHLVIARAGASTVSELAVIGRPSILVPLPGALDQDQAANARVLAEAGAARVQAQGGFTPNWLSQELQDWFEHPERLAAAAAAAHAVARPDAAEQLALLVLKVAGLTRRS